MNVYLFAAVILLLPALCTALGAAGVFLVRRADEPRTRRMLCGMAAGIMLAASVWSLLLPAIERAEAGTLPVWLAPAAGLVLGAVGLLRLEEAAGRLMHTGSKEHGRMGRVVLAVTLHNLPEGMVVGLAAALALQGEPEAVSGALALALGIGLQNIPEGAAVSLPLAQAGQLRRGLMRHPTLQALAGQHHATVPQIMLAFLLARPGVIPIPRTGRAEHTLQNARAAEIRLSAEELALLDKAFAPPQRKVRLEIV